MYTGKAYIKFLQTAIADNQRLRHLSKKRWIYLADQEGCKWDEGKKKATNNQCMHNFLTKHIFVFLHFGWTSIQFCDLK